jgi:hypothetical protein
MNSGLRVAYLEKALNNLIRASIYLNYKIAIELVCIYRLTKIRFRVPQPESFLFFTQPYQEEASESRDGNGAPFPANPWGIHLLGDGNGEL